MGNDSDAINTVSGRLRVLGVLTMNMAPDFKLVDNWIRILKYGWSIRFNVLSAVSAGAAAMLPYTTPDSSAFGVLSAILAGCAALFAGLSAFSRVMQQKNVSAVRCIK